MKMPFFSTHSTAMCALGRTFCDQQYDVTLRWQYFIIVSGDDNFLIFGALVWDHEKLETEIDSAPEQQPPCFDK